MPIVRENFKIVRKNINMRGFNLQGTHLNTNLASNLAVDRLCNQPSMMDLFFPINGYPCGRIFVHLSDWWLKINAYGGMTKEERASFVSCRSAIVVNRSLLDWRARTHWSVCSEGLYIRCYWQRRYNFEELRFVIGDEVLRLFGLVFGKFGIS